MQVITPIKCFTADTDMKYIVNNEYVITFIIFY